MGRDGLTVKGTTQDFNDESLQKTLKSREISNWTGNAKTKFAKTFQELKHVNQIKWEN